MIAKKVKQPRNRRLLIFISLGFIIIYVFSCDKSPTSSKADNQAVNTFANDLRISNVPKSDSAMLAMHAIKHNGIEGLAKVAASLPSSFDLSSKCPPVGDQLHTGTCYAWATAYYAKTILEKTQESWDQQLVRHQFSPSWLANQLDGGNCMTGVGVGDALNMIKNNGCDNVDNFPFIDYDCTRQPDYYSSSRAARYKGNNWSIIPEVILNPAGIPPWVPNPWMYSDMKSALVAGNPVIIRCEDFPDLDNLDISNDTYNSSAQYSRGGHVLCIVGYDDARKAFHFINSWGVSKGINGYGWIGYDFLIDPKLGLEIYVMYDQANVRGWNNTAHTRVLADVNGDGKKDIVGFGYDGVYVSPSHGNNFGSATIWHTDFCVDKGWDANTVKCVADVNGDGKADIVGFGYNEVYVALSNGNGFGPNQMWHTDFCYNDGWNANTVRTVADVNGDGKADIVAFGFDGVYVALSNGTSFGPKQKWSTDFCYNNGWDGNTVRTMADVNGDGKADIIGFGYNDVYVSLSNGSGFNVWQVWNSDYCYNDGWNGNTVRTVADVNGDGKADIVGFGINEVYVSLSNGASFGSNQMWHTDFCYNDGWNGNTARRIADVTGDGKADIVGFGINEVVVAPSTGSNFNGSGSGTWYTHNYVYNSNEWY
jgi:C1A family cysteine protease